MSGETGSSHKLRRAAAVGSFARSLQAAERNVAKVTAIVRSVAHLMAMARALPDGHVPPCLAK
eukprot:1716763-Heterocapsa_arctica.AAC.1